MRKNFWLFLAVFDLATVIYDIVVDKFTGWTWFSLAAGLISLLLFWGERREEIRERKERSAERARIEIMWELKK